MATPVRLHHPQNCLPRRAFLAATNTIIASFILDPFSPARNLTANKASTPGTTLNFVAHEDDDLLFLSPDLLHAIQSGRNVRTIYITAGDNGKTSGYWKAREAGSKAAYAQMAGVKNSWTQTDAGISDRPFPVFTLTTRPTVSLAYMRLPGGNANGAGFSSTDYESLQKLWTKSISTIHAIDGSSTYTKATLTSTLTSLMSSFQPDQINSQNYVGSYNDGDHSDHHSVAYFVQAAQQQYKTPHTFTGYEDYSIASLAANVTGADLAAKRNAFYVYALHDPNVSGSISSYSSNKYALWFRRQYTVGSQSGRRNQPSTIKAGSADGSAV